MIKTKTIADLQKSASLACELSEGPAPKKATDTLVEIAGYLDTLNLTPGCRWEAYQDAHSCYLVLDSKTLSHRLIFSTFTAGDSFTVKLITSDPPGIVKREVSSPEKISTTLSDWIAHYV